MSTHHIDKPDAFLMKMIKTCYPSYNGRKFKIDTDTPSQLRSYWAAGSKDNFIFYELATGKIAPVHSNHPFFEADQPTRLKKLPVGFVIVKHSIFCGKDMGITVYGNIENINPLLPAKEELTTDEDAVLYFTRSLKSSYAGIKNYRHHEAQREMGITIERWEIAKTELIKKKLLNKRGAITPAGRNAVGDRFCYRR